MHQKSKDSLRWVDTTVLWIKEDSKLDMPRRNRVEDKRQQNESWSRVPTIFMWNISELCITGWRRNRLYWNIYKRPKDSRIDISCITAACRCWIVTGCNGTNIHYGKRSRLDQFLFHTDHSIPMAFSDNFLVGWAEVEEKSTSVGSGWWRNTCWRKEVCPVNSGNCEDIQRIYRNDGEWNINIRAIWIYGYNLWRCVWFHLRVWIKS